MSATVELRSTTASCEAFSERLLRSAAGAFDLYTIHVGHRLGLYAALADSEPITSAELAERCALHERYVREWLEQQAVAGLLEVDDEEAPAGERRYRLLPAPAEVLADPESLNYLAPLAQIMVAVVRPIDQVLEAFRTGAGVPFSAYGEDARHGQAGMNRAAFLQQLGQQWLPAVPGLDARLQSDRGARVADIGCGVGWSSIGVALAYPGVTVDAFDLDGPSIDEARRNAARCGVADRVTFHCGDAAKPSLDGPYDLVMALECVHDLSDPVGVLRTMRRLAGSEGTVLVMDERVCDRFCACGNEVEWMMYGFSVLHCLPVGMAESPSAATGTVMRPETLRRYAREAGFRDAEVLPIENFFFRFYRLVG